MVYFESISFFHFKKENCQMVIHKQDYIEMYNEKIPDEFEGACSPPIDTYLHYKFVNEIFLA